MPEHGGIYANDGATGTAANAVTGIDSTSWTKVTGFTDLSPANGVAVNAGIDELEALADGIYHAFCNLSYFGPVNTRIEFAILRDDLATVIKQDDTFLITGTFASKISLGGLIELDAGDRVALGVQFETGTGEITVKHGHLGLYGVS